MTNLRKAGLLVCLMIAMFLSAIIFLTYNGRSGPHLIILPILCLLQIVPTLILAIQNHSDKNLSFISWCILVWSCLLYLPFGFQTTDGMGLGTFFSIVMLILEALLLIQILRVPFKASSTRK